MLTGSLNRRSEQSMEQVCVNLVNPAMFDEKILTHGLCTPFRQVE